MKFSEPANGCPFLSASSGRWHGRTRDLLILDNEYCFTPAQQSGFTGVGMNQDLYIHTRS